MSVIKTLNKLNNKVELSSEVLEFSSVKMIESILKDAKEVFKDGKSFAKEMEAFQKKAKQLNQRAAAMESGATSELKEFEKQSKSLGFNPNDLKTFKELKTLLGGLDTVKAQTAKFK